MYHKEKVLNPEINFSIRHYDLKKNQRTMYIVYGGLSAKYEHFRYK